MCVQLLARYEDPLSDCEEDPLTSSDNTIGKKRRTRYAVCQSLLTVHDFEQARKVSINISLAVSLW